MKKSLVLISLAAFFLVSAGLWAEDAVVYYVVPLEKGAASVAGKAEPSKVQYFPMLQSNYEKKVLYFVEPMEKKIKSYGPRRIRWVWTTFRSMSMKLRRSRSSM